MCHRKMIFLVAAPHKLWQFAADKTTLQHAEEQREAHRPASPRHLHTTTHTTALIGSRTCTFLTGELNITECCHNYWWLNLKSAVPGLSGCDGWWPRWRCPLMCGAVSPAACCPAQQTFTGAGWPAQAQVKFIIEQLLCPLPLISRRLSTAASSQQASIHQNTNNVGTLSSDTEQQHQQNSA